MFAQLYVIDLGLDVRVELFTFAPMANDAAVDLVRRAGRLVDANQLAARLRISGDGRRAVVIQSGQVERPAWLDPLDGAWFGIRHGGAVAIFQTLQPFTPRIEVFQ